MAEYYYFIASLPTLYIDKEPPLSYESFLERAREQVSKRDFEDLKLVTFKAEGDAKLPLVKEWESFIYKINEYMTEARARKLSLDDKEYKSRADHDKALEDRVNQIVELDNPLEAERALLALYFDFLSTRESYDPFSSRSLMIYGLKLQIIERSAAFSQDKGRAEFDRLFKDVQKDIFHKE